MPYGMSVGRLSFFSPHSLIDFIHVYRMFVHTVYSISYLFFLFFFFPPESNVLFPMLLHFSEWETYMVLMIIFYRHLT